MKSMRRVEYKDGVILTVDHMKHSIMRIIDAADRCYPSSVAALVITRGCEECSNGKLTSKHLYPTCDALDFRTWYLPTYSDRQTIVVRMQAILGCAYYGYYKRYVASGAEGEDGRVVEWIHFQYNGGSE